MQNNEELLHTRQEYAAQEHENTVEEKTARMRQCLNIAIIVTVCLLALVLLILFKL